MRSALLILCLFLSSGCISQSRVAGISDLVDNWRDFSPNTTNPTEVTGDFNGDGELEQFRIIIGEQIRIEGTSTIESSSSFLHSFDLNIEDQINTGIRYTLSLGMPGRSYQFVGDTTIFLEHEHLLVHSAIRTYVLIMETANNRLLSIKLDSEINYGGIHFSFSSCELLLEESQASLNAMATTISEHPNREFQIQYHTESRGKSAYNDQLSTLRARCIQDYLIAKDPSIKDRVTIKPMGESDPIIIFSELDLNACEPLQEEVHLTNRRAALSW